MNRWCAAILLAITFPMAGNAQNRVYTPARGSVERNAMMDALRVPIVRQLGGPVVFADVKIWALNGWAFVQTTPTSPRDEPLMDRFRARIGDDNRTDDVVALLRWTGTRWSVAMYEIGPTEYPYEWDRLFPSARRVFPWNQRQR